MKTRTKILALAFVTMMLPGLGRAQSLAVSSKVATSGGEKNDLLVHFNETALASNQSVSYVITGNASCGSGPASAVGTAFSLTSTRNGGIKQSIYVEEPADCIGAARYSNMLFCDQDNSLCVNF
jgi:hypothetical protein